jgi:hypothetical protein
MMMFIPEASPRYGSLKKEAWLLVSQYDISELGVRSWVYRLGLLPRGVGVVEFIDAGDWEAYRLDGCVAHDCAASKAEVAWNWPYVG